MISSTKLEPVNWTGFVAEYPDGKIETEGNMSWSALADLQTIKLGDEIKQAFVCRESLKSITVNHKEMTYKIDLGDNERAYYAIKNRMMMHGTGSTQMGIGRTVGKIDAEGNVLEEYFLNGITNEIEKVK